MLWFVHTNEKPYFFRKIPYPSKQCGYRDNNSSRILSVISFHAFFQKK